LPTLIGRVLGGRFAIVEQLGKGGSGEVYRADQTQLGRSAVIKVLRRDLTAGAGRVERFLREAKLASRLDHPYAAHIYAFGAETDNVLWIAMEHVRGVTLDELVTKRGAMPANIFAPLFARLCEVVHTAHELGIVHRDIKGANVMVIERAGQLLPKLLDFGIAKFEGTEVTPAGAGSTGVQSIKDSDLTAHGATLGSPHYMSPEQWSNAADVDARADIYALGVLAYRCLAGYLPFHTLARNQLAEAHTKQAVPPMPDFVTAPLAEIVGRALAKQPAERWPTAVAFADALVRGAGATVKESVPLFDPLTRDAWLAAGPQPIADAVAHLTSATTTVEADGALRDLVAITCRWLAVLGLAGLPPATTASNPNVRERARAVTGRDDGAPWLALAHAAVSATSEPLPALTAALKQADVLGKLAARLDERERVRTAAALAVDIAAAAEALLALEPLLAYQLVLGLPDGVAESWQGPRRRERERVLVWGPSLVPGEVALLDAGGKVVARLSPFAQVIAPLPAAEPELFLLWRSGRGSARLVAAPWGFERDDERAGHVLAVLSTEESDSGPADDERSPYPGLAAYGVDDADHFVGREREVETLANRLVRSPLVAVLGPSGVGKSSFIHAGLLARLGDSYRVLTMRPGRHPMHALASLPPVSSDSHDDTALAGRLRELGESAQRGLVLVIDQLEELVTLCSDATERTRFAETIATAASGPDAPVRVIATLRDDFATVIESEAALRGRFDVFVLAAPSPDALRRIVIEPARHANVTVDARVVDDMVTAVAGLPSSLPLLSFTAAQLWKTRDRAARKITYDAYAELGGVAGALATYADQVYASLARRDQDTVRNLFARLVAADGTRIPSPRRELDQLSGAPGVLAHLVDARLLVVRDDEGTDVIEIVHECLAERWPRLARWRSEDAADRALLGDVRAAARRWHEGGRQPDQLWRGEAVRELGRLATHSTALTDVERAFAHDATNAQQRARRVRRGIVAAAMIVLAAAAAVMAYLGITANENRAEAVRNASAAADAASLAEERLTASLIAQGRRELNDNRAITALAYFAAAMKRGADSQGLRAMVSIATRGWKHIRMTYRATPINTVTGSPNGWIAAGDQAGTVRWWSDAGTLLGQLTVEVGSISSVERQSDDGLVIVGQRGIVLANAERQIVRRIKIDEPPWFASRGPAADEVFSVQPGEIRIFGPDANVRRKIPVPPGMAGNEPVFIAGNTRVLVNEEDETLASIDMKTLARKVVARRVWGEATASSDGSRFAYVDRDRNVHLHASDGREIKNLGLVARPNQVIFSPTGDRVGIVGDRDLTIFDGSGEIVGVFPIELDQTQYLLRGDDAWTTGLDGVLRHYHDGRLVASVPVHATEVQQRAIGKDSLALLATDASLVLVDAAATDIEELVDPCERVAYTAQGIAAGYECGNTVQLYVGRDKVAEMPVTPVMYNIDYLPSAKRAVVSDGRVSVFESGKRIAQTDKPGPAAFISTDELYVLEPKQALWKWTVSSNAWSRILPVGEAYAVAALADGPVLAEKSAVIRIRAGAEIARVDVGGDVAGMVASPDRRWLAVHLVSGATAIIDATTWKVARTLPVADNYGGWPTFDASGELLLRSSRQAMSIWDHASGDELVFNFDLLRDLSNARFLPDGSLEVNRRSPGHLTIPRDSRPIDAILRDIDCRVPLEVVGSRVQPKAPRCQ
jgi:tRNA A-37 threonylcarbamoyl transferase component Bud32